MVYELDPSYEWESMQNCTSAGTSVNSKKLPALFTKVKFNPGDVVLDWGCGKYIDHIKAKVEGDGAMYWPFDPYNLPGSTPCPCDVAVCSNVLNVIDDDEEMEETIHMLCHASGIVYITVYEGDRSGVGRVTKADCYQRNQPLKWYYRLITEKLGYKATMKNGVICINPM